MSTADTAIHYTLGMSNPASHLFELEMEIEGIPAGTASLDVRLPVWRPGRYMILDLANGVHSFSAADQDDRSLSWVKVEKSLWRVETKNARTVRIRYNVFANEFNLRTRGLNDEHAFVDGATVFMYVEEFRKLPVRLTVRPYGNWHVTTGLEGSGRSFSAKDYDYFVDCPLEIGTQKDVEFDVEGTPHVLSLFGEGNWNLDTLVTDVSRIISTVKAFWGEFPYKRYVFLVHCTPTSGGGTEHVNSTILGTRPFSFRNPDSYRGFLGLVAHEYFHTWNVKQLRPRGIVPYDFTRENYSRELWIAEGMTSYYDELLLVRAGYQSPEKYVERLASTVQNDRQRPGNSVQSVSESSFDAWIKFWKSNPQAYNYESDYYDRGATVSLNLDLEIRQRSQNRKSLDDVLRTMLQRFPSTGPGYTLEDFRSVTEEVSGTSFAEFFDNFVFGTKPLEWERVLGYAGISVEEKDSIPKPWSGFTTSDVGDRTVINRVIKGSPAFSAGLDIGDEIVALNGYRARTADIASRINDLKPNDVIKLTLFRNEKLREFILTLADNPEPGYAVRRAGSPSELQKGIYEKWLSTTWK